MMSTCLWFSLLLLAPVEVIEHAQFFQREINPVTYFSPSGVYAAEVDSIGRYGEAGAEVVLRKNQVEVWRQTLPVYMAKFVVSDSGYIAGYGHTSAKLIVLILDPQGELVLDEQRGRKPRGVHLPGSRQGQGVLLSAGGARVAIWNEDEELNHGHDEWSVYDLMSGALLSRFRPEQLITRREDRLYSLEGAVWIQGTSLSLLRYRVRRKDPLSIPETEEDALFQIVGVHGRQVWQRYFSRAEVGRKQSKRLWSERDSGIASSDPGRFSIELETARQILQYSIVVSDGPGSKWLVSELGRDSYNPINSSDDKKVDDKRVIPKLLLEDLGRVILGNPKDRENSAYLENPGSAGVSPTGEIVIQDRITGSVNVYSELGDLLRSSEVAVGDRGEITPIAEFAFDSSGSLYIEKNVRGRRHYWGFGPTGESLKPGEFDAKNIAIRPDGSGYWGWNDGLVLIDRSGDLVVRNTRRPGDRHWLSEGRQPSIGPQGEVVVICDRSIYAPGFLSFFSAEGVGLRTVLLPPLVEGNVALSDRFLTIHQFSNSFYLFDLESNEFWSVDIDDSDSGCGWFVAFSPDQLEIWAICPRDMILRRFRAP